jgi:hypothetical protein
LRYLSNKIKSNTLKISSTEVPADNDIYQAVSDEVHSQTTASKSDLSIDEMNLRHFKEYMMLSERKGTNII